MPTPHLPASSPTGTQDPCLHPGSQPPAPRGPRTRGFRRAVCRIPGQRPCCLSHMDTHTHTTHTLHTTHTTHTAHTTHALYTTRTPPTLYTHTTHHTHYTCTTYHTHAHICTHYKHMQTHRTQILMLHTPHICTYMHTQHTLYTEHNMHTIHIHKYTTCHTHYTHTYYIHIIPTLQTLYTLCTYYMHFTHMHTAYTVYTNAHITSHTRTHTTHTAHTIYTCIYYIHICAYTTYANTPHSTHMHNHPYHTHYPHSTHHIHTYTTHPTHTHTTHFTHTHTHTPSSPAVPPRMGKSQMCRRSVSGMCRPVSPACVAEFSQRGPGHLVKTMGLQCWKARLLHDIATSIPGSTQWQAGSRGDCQALGPILPWGHQAQRALQLAQHGQVTSQTHPPAAHLGPPHLS